jgi:hypothetical protein
MNWFKRAIYQHKPSGMNVSYPDTSATIANPSFDELLQLADRSPSKNLIGFVDPASGTLYWWDKSIEAPDQKPELYFDISENKACHIGSFKNVHLSPQLKELLDECKVHNAWIQQSSDKPN